MKGAVTKDALENVISTLDSKEQHFMVYDFDGFCMFPWKNYLSPLETDICGAQSHVILNKVRG